MSDAREFDAVIVGANMIGATVACALADAGLRIAVIEVQPPIAHTGAGAYDTRVSALTPASETILRNVGVWEHIAARRVSPVREMQVWTDSDAHSIHFDCADVGTPTLGHIVENALIQSALWERLRVHANVTLFCPAAPRTYIPEQNVASARLNDGTTLNAPVLIGADGAQSWVRQHADITQEVFAYEQKAIVANIAASQPHRATAWQRFSADGIVALLPLANSECSLVWSADAADADRLMALDDATFNRALMRAFGPALGELRVSGPRHAFPLQRSQADHYVQARIALIGDAAHTVHPLAGQGANLGFLDAAVLADVLIDARAANKDLGDLAVLRTYEQRRKTHNLGVASAMSAFKYAFSSHLAPLRWAAAIGFDVVDHTPPLKNLLVKFAVGGYGDMPRLAR